MRLLAVSVGWVTGVVLALQWNVPFVSLMLLLVSSGLLVLVFWIRKWSLLIPVALAALIVGMLRVGVLPPPPPELGPWLGLDGVEVEGVIGEPPEIRGTASRFLLHLERINDGSGWQDVSGGVLVTASPSLDLTRQREAPFFRYGDRLLLDGELEDAPVFADFNYREYLARRGINALMFRPEVTWLEEGQGSRPLAILHSLRLSLARALDASLPEAADFLCQGRASGNPRYDAFRRCTGFSQHGDISSTGHFRVARWRSPWPGSAGSGGYIRQETRPIPLAPARGYLAVCPSQRAIAFSGARRNHGQPLSCRGSTGQAAHALPALGFAAAFMVALDPQVVYDVSFQLSFAAMAGIITLWPPLETAMRTLLARIAPGNGWPEGLGYWAIASVAVSTAAVIATLPILAFYFHRIALLSIPATLIALPALPLILATSMATAIAGLVHSILGQAIGWLAWLPLYAGKLPATSTHLLVCSAWRRWRLLRFSFGRPT